MKYATALAGIAVVASALTVRQTNDQGVYVGLVPSYNCLGSDPLATIGPDFLDGACHDLGVFNSTLATLSRTDLKQTLTYFEDSACSTSALALTNPAAGGPATADGSCVNAPKDKSFKGIKYQTTPLPY